MSVARLARIVIYPVKSLDGASVSSAEIDAAGALKHDRYHALFDEKGVFVNGKREARLNLIRARYSEDLRHITLNAPDHPERTADLFDEAGTRDIEAWLSAFLDRKIRLQRNDRGGFPDDTDRPGPTIVSRATLKRVGEWLAEKNDNLSLEELSRRFRSNLELDECEPFTEDRFYGDTILVGEAKIEALSPCARCVVPSRDSRTGELLKGFPKTLTDRRRAELPAGVDPARFDHFYRLAVNTRVPASETGKIIRVGDPVKSEFQFDFEL